MSELLMPVSEKLIYLQVMEKKQFKRVNNIVSLVVLLLSSFVYLSTIEPTASFWDCGEFIASSYKMEVGHPPGNPAFNLFARIFTMFTDNMHAAIAVNAMSALCSALTIFFLYLSIVHFCRRINEKRGRELTLGNAIGVMAAGVVGAMAYCFSDTFWFSAVEGEVYAMSSLFTALVIWAALRWEEDYGNPYANRWLVLISFLMGISIGVHLLNLLAIPGIVFIIYYRMHEDKKCTFWQLLGILALSGAILGVILFGIIPILPKILAYVDRIFVNGFGAAFNVGAATAFLLFLAGCFFGLKFLRKKEKALGHTILLCFTTIVIGYSIFAITIIRSSANTPTNEYQPDNPYTLIRYISREQYGSTPILYGQAFTSPYEVEYPTYYTPLNGKYYAAENIVPKYPSSVKMLFPRMWYASDERSRNFLQSYCDGMNRKNVKIYGENRSVQMPKFKDNLAYFFDYQLSYMYLRYFMWNFAGRQNDFQGSQPGDLFAGNWECGIGFIDRARLGDQSDGPDILINNKAKNHYYLLPLILGLFGLFFQMRHDERNSWVTGLLFLLTGFAIIIYLNQTPFQVRERDYAYAGSFYMFCVWIGLGVMALQNTLERLFRKDGGIAPASAAAALALVVPAIMGCQNWDDHDRSGRTTARDMAYNYLMGLDENALLITHGDNDTFPMWYIQEVEGVRTDVRIVNTSLLGTDWFIDQMKRRQYESAPLPITMERKHYLYGTNDYPYVVNAIDRPILAKEAIEVFKNPKFKLSDGKTDYIPATTILVPVNKENVKKYKIVPEADFDRIADYVELHIDDSRVTKLDLIFLDMLANYEWDRPIYSVIQNADASLGLENWMQYNGFCYKFVPIRTDRRGEDRYIDADDMYDKVMNVYKLDSFDSDKVYYDYQNLYTFCSVLPIRDIFSETARALVQDGKKEKALEVLDKAVSIMPNANFPYCLSWLKSINEISMINIIEIYLECGAKEKGLAVAEAFTAELLKTISYFGTEISPGEKRDEKILEDTISLFYYEMSMLKDHGHQDKVDEFTEKLYMALNLMMPPGQS